MSPAAADAAADASALTPPPAGAPNLIRSGGEGGSQAVRESAFKGIGGGALI